MHRNYAAVSTVGVLMLVAVLWPARTADQVAAPEFHDIFAAGEEYRLDGTPAAPLFGAVAPFLYRDRVYVADHLGHKFLVFDVSGRLIHAHGSKGSADEQFVMPYGVIVDTSGLIYVNDRGNQRIEVFDSAMRHVRSIPVRGQNEQLFLVRTPRRPAVLLLGASRCGTHAVCLAHAREIGGPRSWQFARLAGRPPMFTWRGALAGDSVLLFGNVLGRELEEFTIGGNRRRRIPLSSPSHKSFVPPERNDTEQGLAALLQALRDESYTSIRSIILAGSRIIVQLELVNPPEGEQRFVMDMYDRSGRLLTHGTATPGILHEAHGRLYFVSRQEEEYGSLRLQMVSLR